MGVIGWWLAACTGKPVEEPPEPAPPRRTVGTISVAAVEDVEFRGYRMDPGGIAVGQTVQLGDLDGDGLSDAIVGASEWSGGSALRGTVYVALSGRLTGCDPTDGGALACALESPPPGVIVLVGPDVTGAQFGTTMGVGDLDADGFDDLVVGALGADHVSLFYGGPDGPSTTPDAEFGGATHLGAAVAIVGDVTGDGCPDLAIGAQEAAESRGAIFVFASPPSGGGCGRLASKYDVNQGQYSARILGADTSDYAGAAVAPVGDFDGDGDADLLIGAPNGVKEDFGPEPGDGWVLYGGSDPRELGACGDHCELDLNDFGASGAWDAVRYTLPEGEGNEWFGAKGTGVGDATGDGCDDILLGAMRYSDAGLVRSGAAYLIDGAGACDGGERPVSDAVILDGSGDDYVIQFLGDEYDDKLGEAVADGGDFDGDGFGDLLIGEYRDNELGENTGAAYLIYGGWPGFDQDDPATVVLTGERCAELGDTWPADVPPYLKLHGSTSWQAFGKHVRGGGDLDADGLGDLLIGAPRWSITGGCTEEEDCDQGAAFVVQGETSGCVGS